MLFTLPMILTLVATAVFLTAERIWPGRELPNSPGWYVRALGFNACQLAITVLTNSLWLKFAGGVSLLKLSALEMPVLEGFLGWFVGSFFFYWWHRLRHASGFWRVFHQIHHSPVRIEALTSFYKHPVEIFSDSLLAAVVLYVVCGVSIEGALWFNFFAATGEYFYHANLRTPVWVRYFIQTPELHSVHHELDVHRYNFSDLPLWDRMFGTYRDAIAFAPACGFPNHNERKVPDMLTFRDGLCRRARDYFPKVKRTAVMAKAKMKPRTKPLSAGAGRSGFSRQLSSACVRAPQMSGISSRLM